MTNNVSWLLALQIRPGKLDAFRDLVDDMVSATLETEPGTLNYEWFVTPDNSTCHIYERYVDSDATLPHLAAFGANFAERFMAILEPVGFTVYGSPSAEVVEALSAFGPVHMAQVGGFAR